MKRISTLLILAASSSAFAQDAGGNAVFFRTGGAIGVGGAITTFEKGSSAPVQGAPYTATMTNEVIQTLADGNRIVHTSSGTIARDSQGRTRQDAPLPSIGNLSAANAPHLVFIRDPVTQTSYTLNLTDKTAEKMPMPPATAGGSGPANTVFIQMGTAIATAGAVTGGPLPPPTTISRSSLAVNVPTQESTESLGSQTMGGGVANGVRTTRTIPAGQIGNDNPISIVTEVWTSTDLKTIVYSKRSDPQIGQQTFSLTNVVRAEPDASLFTVPADFTVVDGSQPIIYRSNQ